MSFASEHEHRRRRQRRENARWIVTIVRTILSSAVMIAVAMTYDLPGMLREKWFPAQPAMAVQTQNKAPSQEKKAFSRGKSYRRSTSPITKTSISQARAKERRDIQAANRFQRQPNLEYTEEIPGANARQSPQQPQNLLNNQAAEKSNAQAEDFGRLVAIDMSRKSQIVPLTGEMPVGAEYPTVRIVAINGLGAGYGLSSPDRSLARGEELFVRFNRTTYARFRLSLDRVGQRIVLRVEPQMALWADDPMPFTLKKIAQEAMQTRRRATQFMGKLSAFRSEKASLEAWINTPGLRPLQALTEAKTRVATLGNQIRQMESQVETIKEQVRAVNDLEAFAKQLHKKTQLQFVVIEKERE